MKRIFKLLYFVALFSISLLINAQENNLSEVTPITYKDNIKAPLNSGELLMITEVYGDFVQQYVLDKPEKLKSVKNILRNRVRIYEENIKDLSGFNKLSQVALFDVFNNNLKRDIIFNPNTFNPLKYDFNYNSRDKSKRYRVDNTNYVIVIYSQYQL